MNTEPWKTAVILIVDDEDSVVRLLERLLRGDGYGAIFSTTDPRQAPALFEQHHPDLVLLDLHMPHVEGYEVLAQLTAQGAGVRHVPIVMLTGDLSPVARQRALSMGAQDFLSKPFDQIEVLLRIKNLLETRWLYLELQRQNDLLEDKVDERRLELEAAQKEILDRLARAAEFRDDDTRLHTQRVGDVSARIAAIMGLPDALIALIRQAAPLHDLGKIGMPDDILLKLGALTDDEKKTMQQHTVIGARILSGSSHAILQMAEQIALTHHERWDGRGYLAGLKGDDIPLVSRIVAVADVFDALTHRRPYKEPWPVKDALIEIENHQGRQFDPQVVAALRQVVQEVFGSDGDPGPGPGSASGGDDAQSV
jgi:putative two-component system response regulator